MDTTKTPYYTYQRSNKWGFSILLGTLIVGSIGVLVATTVLLLGVGATKSSFTVEHSERARVHAHACAEEALERIRVEAFTGNGVLSFSYGDCSYSVTKQGQKKYTIQSIGTANDTIRRELVLISDPDPMTVSSWQEVLNF